MLRIKEQHLVLFKMQHSLQFCYGFCQLSFVMYSSSKQVMDKHHSSPFEGRVVGIIQKNWRDYVVTFPVKDEIQSHGKNVQKILVTPWDYRIPKIRISTQQAEALQVK